MVFNSIWHRCPYTKTIKLMLIRREQHVQNAKQSAVFSFRSKSHCYTSVAWIGCPSLKPVVCFLSCLWRCRSCGRLHEKDKTFLRWCKSRPVPLQMPPDNWLALPALLLCGSGFRPFFFLFHTIDFWNRKRFSHNLLPSFVALLSLVFFFFCLFYFQSNLILLFFFFKWFHVKMK